MLYGNYKKREKLFRRVYYAVTFLVLFFGAVRFVRPDALAADLVSGVGVRRVGGLRNYAGANDCGHAAGTGQA